MTKPHSKTAYGETFDIIKDYARYENPSAIEIINVHLNSGVCLKDHADQWDHFWQRVHLSDYFFQKITLFSVITEFTDEDQAEMDIEFSFILDHYDDILSTYYFFLGDHQKDKIGFVARDVLGSQIQELGIHQSKIYFVEQPGGKDAIHAKWQGFPVIESPEVPTDAGVTHFFNQLLAKMSRTDQDIIKAIKAFDESTIKPEDLDAVREHYQAWIRHLSKGECAFPRAHKAAYYDIIFNQENRLCLTEAMSNEADKFNPLVFFMKQQGLTAKKAATLCAKKKLDISLEDIQFAFVWSKHAQAKSPFSICNQRYLQALYLKTSQAMASKPDEDNPRFFSKVKRVATTPGIQKPHAAGKASVRNNMRR